MDADQKSLGAKSANKVSAPASSVGARTPIGVRTCTNCEPGDFVVIYRPQKNSPNRSEKHLGQHIKAEGRYHYLDVVTFWEVKPNE
jgi:hypothetical protein